MRFYEILNFRVTDLISVDRYYMLKRAIPSHRVTFKTITINKFLIVICYCIHDSLTIKDCFACSLGSPPVLNKSCDSN